MRSEALHALNAPQEGGDTVTHDAPGRTVAYRTLFEQQPGNVLVLDTDAPHFTIVAATDAYCRATRTAREEMIGRGCFEVFRNRDSFIPGTPQRRILPDMRESLLEVLRTGAPHRPRIQRYDLLDSHDRVEVRYWQPLNSPIVNGDGTVRYIAHQVEDVTAEMLGGAALLDTTRESVDRYRTILESIDEGFCVLEMLFDDEDRPIDYRFVDANSAFEKQTGLHNAVGRTARELVPDLEPHWFELYGGVARTGQPIRFEQGSAAMGRWFDVYAFPVGAPRLRLVALLFSDITEQRAAAEERERLLRELEVERSRLAEVFRQAPSFLAVLRGPDLVFELVNDAYYQLVGHRELIGRPAFEALPDARDQGFEALLANVQATGVPFIGSEVPVQLVRTPGALPELRFVNLSYLPLTEADGTRSGVIAHGSDVTEHVNARREAERLLQESELARAEAEAARAEAEVANRAKGEFLAVMSHELRTPLNAIGGYAELMEMGIRGPVTEQQREDLRRIQTSQRHLLGLINEVLNYAKLETGAVHYDLGDVLVRDATAAAEALVMPQARARGLALMVSDCDPELVVRADPEKLRQILVNLLSNAIKFTERGGRVELSFATDEERVIFTVRDTGIGIPASRHHAIFDPFVQVRADLTRTHEGTGLGLAISRDLARGMGGDLVLIESEPEVGSTFQLRLPRA